MGMAKKATTPEKVEKVGLSKTKPKSEAIPLGTKKEKKPAKKKATVTASEAGVEREATQGEIDLLKKRRNTVAAFIRFRDDIPYEIADQIVAGMEPEEVGDLYQESQISEAFQMVLASYEADAESSVEPEGVPLAEPVVPEFTEFPGLLTAEEDFPSLVQQAVEFARTKNEAERQYKEAKAKLVEVMDRVGVEECMTLGVLTQRYDGKSPKYLDATKLLEKGVSVDIINKCYKQSTYKDVRLTIQKE